MSDLFDPLRDLTQEPASPLPPSEVRRRGDRQRHRRTAAGVLGGACAVAVIAFGASSVADRSPSSSREIPPATQDASPTPAPTETTEGAVTRVPDGFPIDQDMIESENIEGPARSVSWLGDIPICGDMASYSPADEQTDSVGVNHNGVESEYTQRRQLLVYPDVATAQRMALDLVDKFKACPRYDTDTGDTGHGEATNEVSSRDLGDEAWTVKNGYLFNGAPGIGEDIYTIVRAGNAVIFQYTGGEGPGLTDPEAFEASAQAELDGLQAPVAAMCVFTETGCGETGEDGTPWTFGPDGYGDLRLFLTPEEVDDTGQATASSRTPSGLSCTQLTYAGHSKDQVDGFISTFGVVVLFAPGGVTTPEGLGVGSPESDITRLYPDAEKQVAGYRIPLEGGKKYFATVDETGSVAELSLESSDQTCTR